MPVAKKKTTIKKAAKKRTIKKKAVAKKTTKKATTRKKTTVKKATARKKTTRKVAARKKTTTRGKTTRKATTRKETTRQAATKRKTTKKKATKRKPNAAFMRPMTISEELGEIVGNKPIPRTEVTKKLWGYIKRNKLQDSVNKRMINADDKLRRVFGGKGKVSMFEMTKLVSKHMK